MGTFARIATAMLAVLPTVATAATEPVPLQPITDWILDYAPERCSLTRGFGEGDQALRLQIDSFGSTESFLLLLAGPAVPPHKNSSYSEIRLRMTPDSAIREPIYAFRGKAGQLDAASFSLSFQPPFARDAFLNKSDDETRAMVEAAAKLQPAFEKATRNMQVHFSAWNAIDINSGRLSGPLTALRTCTHDLWASWGLDPVRQERLSRPVHLRQRAREQMARNFPASMLDRNEAALVPVRIMVDADGKASDCVIQSDRVKPQFRAAVCNGLGKDYDPALDADGKPVPSAFFTTVIFF